MLRQARRAPKACSWCRQRKVRCDASALGSPCTRCRQDRQDCVISAKPTRRYKSSRASHQAYGSITLHGRLRFDSAITHENVISSSINPKPTEEENQPPGSNYGAIKYPFMDSRPLATLQFDDVARLIANGCFTFPDKEATDAFVYQYFARIHPGLPVFDEAECWKMHEDSVNLQCEKGRLPHNTTLSQLVRNIPSMLDAREVPRLLGGQQYCPQKLDPANSQRWPAGAVLGSHSDSSTAVSSDPNEPRQQKQRHIQLPIYGASTTTALELQDTRDKTGSLNANPTSLDFLDLEDVPGANRNLQPRDGQMELGEHSGHQRLADQGGDGEDSDIGDKSFVSPWFYAINSLREFTADIKP